ncbi:MAG: nicotinate (nicotinamide) nucleotide adenylyltransferase [Chitinophagaceae bacterium]|nr:nicotinate (nicotinamide) nucleotide adenylyltransferase [Chitinophagaceae bacterium]
MNIGLYFGSFNPIHIAHLIIANYILNETDIEKIWFVVSPQNPLKPSGELLNEYQRLHLVRLAVEDEPRMKASDIEFYLPRPSYTIDTLTYLNEKYPEYRFCIIMGSDSYQNLPKWKNYEQLLRHYPLYIYRRPGFDLTELKGAEIHVLDAPLLHISASLIRKYLREGKSIRFFVPEKVFEEIMRAGYYRN